MGVIVVGVDNSEGARSALRFALEEAKLRGATLRAVHAWQFASTGAPGIEAGHQPTFGVEFPDLQRSVEAALEATLHEAIPDPGDVEVERRVVEGTAAAALVEESRGADLLVVGSRGLGGFRGLLLGSVGQQVAHHAACPVVIVPHRREDWRMDIRKKRAYEAPATSDGYRVLIDRLWPRGVPKTDAEIDEWARELAPTTELRRWFGHDPERFDEFRQRYTEELATHENKLRELRRRARKGRLTLVYGARDEEHNDAVVLAEVLRRGRRPR